ncbi:hypothetical protein AA18890_2701 [Komagataeibacter europaeus LMG 18890]|nr:hypothetical protein AA18890_2701 [Komagataeibacter europaeus LMG 18890]
MRVAHLCGTRSTIPGRPWNGLDTVFPIWQAARPCPPVATGGGACAVSTSPNFSCRYVPYSIVKDRTARQSVRGDWVERGSYTPERPLQPDEPD